MAHYFVVTSLGRTATYWLSASLHGHPSIACCHSLAVPPVFEFENPPSMERAKRSWDKMESYGHLSVNGYFDIIESSAVADYYGCVHTYALSGLVHRLKTEPKIRDFKIANIVRHPVTRIESFWRRNTAVAAYVPKHKEFFGKIFKTSEIHQTLARIVDKKFDVDWENSDNWYFIIAIQNLITDRREIDIDVRHFRMEDLTSGNASFEALFKHLTGDRLRPDTDYLSKVSSSAPMNEQNAKLTSPADQFGRWDDWKQFLVRHVAAEHAFVEGYRRFGYELDMLR